MASAKRSKIPILPPILSDFPPDNIMDVHNWRNTSTTHTNTLTHSHTNTHTHTQTISEEEKMFHSQEIRFLCF